jgi:hypothetical protein
VSLSLISTVEKKYETCELTRHRNDLYLLFRSDDLWKVDKL